LEAEIPKASGSLRNSHGRKDTVSRKTRCSIFMHMIFRPLMISSGVHFNMIALFRMKCKSKALALCAIATILLAHWRGLHRYVKRSPTESSQNVCRL